MVEKSNIKGSSRRKSPVKNKIAGYGAGSVDVVMSVDQVAREAAAISKDAPSIDTLEKLEK